MDIAAATPDPASRHAELRLHPDRLLATDPAVREIARRLYEQVAELPIISPHGHVDPAILLEDRPFSDPAELFVTPDHYATRLLHASGVPLAEPGVGQRRLDESAARSARRHLCANWHVFRGTPVRIWLESELASIFEVDLRPSAATADAIYDHLAERLGQDAYRPRALYERYDLELLATTDDPADDLEVHRALAADETFSGRVIPTFRPDRYLEPARPDWPDPSPRWAPAWTSTPPATPATSRPSGSGAAPSSSTARPLTDHSHADTRTDPLERAEAERIHQRALRGEASEAEATAYRRNLVFEMARMSTEDGLTMTLHPGVRRHHRPTFEEFGGETGHDMARRLDSGYLAQLVAEHRLDEDEAVATGIDLVAGRPKVVFGL